MTLTAGTKLGSYQVFAQIAAGGMGEVYRARDTRLNRIVAIKVLPSHLADSPELRERFEREARTIASLNHPHICTLYDIGHQDGTDFLVMEYLEGETLAQRLIKGPPPLAQVLQYAIEIADALDKAHRNGVTHRDLKPGNIMLTKSGTKLLDFGLAKLKQEVAPANVQLSQLPTANDPLTAQGTIVGTLQYMAPEQLEGKEVDARTDIFAFGAVVYEMATGKRAFEGESQASVISAIMSLEPPAMSSLQPMTPPALDRVVKRCVAKEPEDRWQTARDLELELKWIAKPGSQETLASVPAKGIRALGLRTLILSLGTLMLVGMITSLAVWNLKPSAPQGSQLITRLTVTLPPNERLAILNTPVVALSPDGTHLAYIANRNGKQQVYLRALDNLESKAIAGSDDEDSPFFSPDGKWLGFSAAGKLMKMSIDGGGPLTLCEAPNLRGVNWGYKDTIVFAPSYGTFGLSQISVAGGKPQPIISRDVKAAQEAYRWPELLPGGKAMLFTAWNSNLEESQIVTQRLDTGERRILVRGGTDGRYVPTGHLVYARAGTLLAVPFDLKRLELTGVPISIVEGVSQSTEGVQQFSFSDSGTLVYVPGHIQGAERTLVWVDRAGVERPVSAPSRAYQHPRLSPDGQRIAATIQGANDDAWIYDIARQTFTRLTFEGRNTSPIWTPDGKRVVFRSERTGVLNLFWKAADGGGEAERLTDSEFGQSPDDMSPDGQVLVFGQLHPTNGWDLWVLTLHGDRKPRPYLQTRSYEGAGVFSPDGRWLAYVSDESGRYEIYVRPFPGPGGKWQVSTDGGTSPVWARNGELFYRQGNKMMAVDVTAQANFSAGKPKMLFEGRYVLTPPVSNYDVTPDGQRFLMVKENEQAASVTQINVVLNWFEELKQKVPAGTKK